MNHKITIDGYSYRLRPVELSDAAYIIQIRLEDKERTRYIHEIPNDIELEKVWIKNYFEREGDYFFVVENKFSNQAEGLIAIYDETEGRAEWGRWVIKKGSLASVESVYLLYKVAFDKLNLKELYCRTIEDNQSVVSFHSSCGLKTRGVLNEFFTLKDTAYNAVEQYIKQEDFYAGIADSLCEKCVMIFQRFLRSYIGKLEFHHLGIACNNIEREETIFRLLGYRFEEEIFVDSEQGIRGKFGESKNQPRIELLQNIEGSTTLTPYLEKGVKIYHYAYLVSDIEKACEYLKKGKARMVSPLKHSQYFGTRICFFMLSNMMLVELVEKL